ncbi:MAG: carboxypeptidase-like regulatory domain-containing protein [Planctomycetes bacterium]|nr:carboxypeptidase-like regulatory domain-containing protein [Planctomycetota bacterium]
MDVGSTGTTDLELHVWKASTVHGLVLDQLGAPVSGVMVRLQEADPPLASLSHDAWTDQDGFFHCVDIYPGHFRTQIHCPPGHARSAWASPPTQSLDLVGGETVTLELRYLAGSDFSGRVIDAEGAPVRGVDIAARQQLNIGLFDPLCTTDTDANGEFQLRGLPGAEITVVIGSIASSKTSGRQTITKWVADTVDLRNGPAADRSYTVRLMRPFRLDAKIVTQDGRAPSDALRKKARASIVSGDGKRVSLKIGAKGTFDWEIETPSETVTLEVWGQDDSFPKQSFVVVPEPLATREIVVTIR